VHRKNSTAEDRQHPESLQSAEPHISKSRCRIFHRDQIGLAGLFAARIRRIERKIPWAAHVRPMDALPLFERFVRYNNPQVERATQEYVALANKHGIDPAQMALGLCHQSVIRDE